MANPEGTFLGYRYQSDPQNPPKPKPDTPACACCTASTPAIRVFATGASRDTDSGKPDYKGYLSPLAILQFGRYMLKHQTLPDGSTRPSDNWKKGIPKEELIKSLLRHFEDLWLIDEGYATLARGDLEDALCGIFFNTQALMHHLEKEKLNGPDL